jgi:hypothetical protein
MPNVKGRGIRVEIAATFGTAKVVTAVTKANPGVATSAAHAMANNTVGYFDTVAGMVQLEKQACRLKNVTTNTFDLQGLNTSQFSDFVSGNFINVLTWQTLAEATSYRFGGGSAEKLNATRLIDIITQEELGNLPADALNLGLLAQDTPSAAMALFEAAVQTQGICIVRITLGNGAVRVCTIEPGLPGEDVQQGQLGTGSVDGAVKGLVLKLAA